MSRRVKTFPQHLIVFDMDGVIMDVSRSYRETIRQTVRYFFHGAPAYNDLPDPLFSLEDLAEVKQSGGLNNDWETTYRILSLLLTQVVLPDPVPGENAWRLRRKMAENCDLSNLLQFLKTRPYPLRALLQRQNRSENAWVKRFSSGDVGSGNIIKQIFQEIYLGQELFEMTYGIQAEIQGGNGLINQEKLMVEPRFLEMVAGRHILAIATGRPMAEADYPLDFFQIRRHFRMVLTLDDCIAEERKAATTKREHISLSKPNPFMLDAIAGAFAGKVQKHFYIGDMPDDMLAARSARDPFIAVGLVSPSPDSQRLKNRLVKAGADRIVENIQDLEKFLDVE